LLAPCRSQCEISTLINIDELIFHVKELIDPWINSMQGSHLMYGEKDV
jgi:hypothetical protein